MKTNPSKEQKLEWIERARVKHAHGSRYTCNCFQYQVEGVENEDARLWYEKITCHVLKRKSGELYVSDFGSPHFPFSECGNIEHRALWLAWLEVIVKNDVDLG